MSDPRIDEGALRDKVAAPDPSAVSQDADSEAAAAPNADARRPEDRAQARLAQQAVPKLDPGRAVSTHDRPWPASGGVRRPDLAWIASLALIVAGITTILIVFTV